MVRLDGGAEMEEATSVMASAYIDKSSKQVVVVLINYSEENQKVDLSFQSLPNEYHAQKYKLFETSNRSDLQYKGIVGNKFEVPARSILTLVGVE